ncbi:hypothetical protein AAG906_023640 [Vitis piasezkii]
MANSNSKPFDSKTLIFSFLLLLAVLLSFAPSPVLSKSRRPISDSEIRQKKNECYADIESGLWGWQCKSSVIAKENCVYNAFLHLVMSLSTRLEEGEKDFTRSQEYKYCMHRFKSMDKLWGS